MKQWWAEAHPTGDKRQTQGILKKYEVYFLKQHGSEQKRSAI